MLNADTTRIESSATCRAFESPVRKVDIGSHAVYYMAAEQQGDHRVMSDDQDIRGTTAFKMAWAKIIARANYDQSFCHQLQHNAPQLLRSYGVNVPDDIDLNEKVHPKLSEALDAMQHDAPGTTATNCASAASASTVTHQHVHLMSPFSQPHTLMTWGICHCAMSPAPQSAPPVHAMYTLFSMTALNAAPHTAHATHAQPSPLYTGGPGFCGLGSPHTHTQPVPLYTSVGFTGLASPQQNCASSGSPPPGSPGGGVHAMYTFFCGSAA